MMTKALEALKNFTFATRTNLANRKLTNHDALAVIMAHCGTLSRKEITNAMMTWRFGEPEWNTKLQRDWSKPQSHPRYNPGYPVKHPKMGFTYLMNGTHGAGYGFVANDHVGGSIKMHSWQSENGWARRQYWYRSGEGHYTVTVEGMLRVRELGLTPA